MIAPFVRGGRVRLRASARTWFRPVRGGSVSSISLSKRIAPEAVAVAGQQAGERRRELPQHELLRPLDRTEAHRRRPVEEEPRRELAILHVLPDERRVHPGRHVPVDVPDVVTRLVLAQIEEVRPDPAVHGPVAPLQHAVEPADHAPLEAQKQLLGGLGAQACGSAPSCRAQAPPRVIRSLSASSGTGTAWRMRSMISIRREVWDFVSGFGARIVRSARR